MEPDTADLTSDRVMSLIRQVASTAAANTGGSSGGGGANTAGGGYVTPSGTIGVGLNGYGYICASCGQWVTYGTSHPCTPQGNPSVLTTSQDLRCDHCYCLDAPPDSYRQEPHGACCKCGQVKSLRFIPERQPVADKALEDALASLREAAS